MTLQALRAFFKFPHSTCSARHFSSTSIRSPGSASGRLRHGSCFPKPTKTIQNLYMMFSSHKGFSGHRGALHQVYQLLTKAKNCCHTLGSRHLPLRIGNASPGPFLTGCVENKVRRLPCPWAEVI